MTIPINQTHHQYAHPTAFYTAPYAAQSVPVISETSTSVLGLDVKSSTFWKGALMGAAVALLVTNETIQKGVVKTVSKVMAAASGGIEEIKEKYEDAKAEVEAEK